MIGATLATSESLLEEFSSASATARLLFSQCTIPNSREITGQAIIEALGKPPFDIEYIKDNFSQLVQDLQVRAYGLYLAAEREVCGAKLADYVTGQSSGNTKDDASAALADAFFVLDRFCLSLTQSRRTRAGAAFETVVTTLFEALGYPYTFQPDLPGSKPDFVLPSLDHYQAFSTDCLIFTCKRTLRERWRQVVTEGLTGQAFYLATIDENLSNSELLRMKDLNVIIVVPQAIKAKSYRSTLNVISFEVFFDHHLDPALRRWEAHGVI